MHKCFPLTSIMLSELDTECPIPRKEPRGTRCEESPAPEPVVLFQSGTGGIRGEIAVILGLLSLCRLSGWISAMEISDKWGIPGQIDQRITPSYFQKIWNLVYGVVW